MENSVENHVVISQYRLLKNQKYQALERRPLVLSMAMEELPSNLDFRSVYRQAFNSYERKSDAEQMKSIFSTRNLQVTMVAGEYAHSSKILVAMRKRQCIRRRRVPGIYRLAM